MIVAAGPEDRAAQARAIADAFRDLGFKPQVFDNTKLYGSDNFFSIKADRSQSQPTRTEGHLAFIMKDPAMINDPLAGGARVLDLKTVKAGLTGSGQTPGQTSAGLTTYFAVNQVSLRFKCGSVSVLMAFYSEAQLPNKDEGMAQAETARRQLQLEREAENSARLFVQAMEKRDACTTPYGALNVGIGGEYDEKAHSVRVAAGAENRPGVGLGDEDYKWTLDGKIIKVGRKLKSIVVDASPLAPGKHEIVVTITDTVNKTRGAAAFTFEIRKKP
jgi:hypothetical protein